jgi:hypothetical protein
VDQFIALRNVVYEAYIDIKNSGKAQEFDIKGFYEAYRQLCSKYQFLIFMAQGGMYKDQLINLDFLSNAFSLLCLSSVEKLPNYELIRESLASNITQSGKHWLELRQKFDKALTVAEKKLILAQLA